MSAPAISDPPRDEAARLVVALLGDAFRVLGCAESRARRMRGRVVRYTRERGAPGSLVCESLEELDADIRFVVGARFLEYACWLDLEVEVVEEIRSEYLRRARKTAAALREIVSRVEIGPRVDV